MNEITHFNNIPKPHFKYKIEINFWDHDPSTVNVVINTLCTWKQRADVWYIDCSINLSYTDKNNMDYRIDTS